MNIKIGIITICKVNNYGAELQAFATQKQLERMGYQAEIIDYLYYKNWKFKDSTLSQPFVSAGFKRKIIYWLKYRLISWAVDKILPLFNNNERRRKQNYQLFINKGCYSRQYNSMDELYNANMDYDIYITGSDQVWNPSAASSIEPYFLTFAPQKARKFSYASSFGVSSISPELSNRYAQLLNNFNAIAVREQSGVELVKQLTGREAKLVVDPTLLLSKSDWTPYMKPVNGMRSVSFVLIYQLLPSEVLLDIALKIGKDRDIPVYCICKRAYGMKKKDGIINILDAGPAEFLWLIANATCMVTNSFHGTAFSINFATPFCCVLNRKRKNNGRMTSLLSKMNLENRIIYEDNVTNFDTMVVCDKVDNRLLKSLVDESKNYLKDILSPSIIY